MNNRVAKALKGLVCVITPDPTKQKKLYRKIKKFYKPLPNVLKIIQNETIMVSKLNRKD